MYKGRKVTAVVTAAGSGRRMGTPLPKQFLKIGGKTVLEKAVEPFEASEHVDEIIVVGSSEFLELCTGLCRQFSKFSRAVAGGKERQDSVRNALNLVEDGYVLIHDGARPYVDMETIMRVLEAAAGTGAAVAAVPVKDTVRQTRGGDNTDSITLPRDRLYSVQTPQGFDVALIREAYAAAEAEGFLGTDDGGLAERAGHPVTIVEGSYRNIKITTQEDLPMETRIGTGFDVHRLTEGRKLILCGTEIPFEKGLLGHSDADVAVHALMDAMLGAAAMGDIGRHFPDTDDAYKGISSMILLQKVRELIEQEGFRLGNADITIMAQRPKLSPYIEKMRTNIAAVLGMDAGSINVKATTTEKLGFVGRQEGIAAEAICTINRG
ncbi:MAG: 2-C-methyl-D-erythritol 4-phosphate cytidylyltransferase [Candidatus Fimisoma sp.]